MNPVNGTTPALLEVRCNPTNLAPGIYLGQVTVSSGLSVAVANVFFSVGSGSTGGNLAVDTTALTFIGDATSSVLPTQMLNVSSPTSGVGFSAFATSTGNWLSVTPFGTTPTTLTVTANQAGLTAGPYSGTITLVPTEGNPTIVPVTLLASGMTAVTETITLGRFSLNFNHQIGTSAPPNQTVQVATGAGPRSYTAATTTPWIDLVTPQSPSPADSVTGSTPGAFTVLAVPAGLTPGTYTGTVTVSSAGLAPQDLPVSLKVTTGPALNAEPSSIDVSNGDVQVLITSTGAANLSFTATIPASGSPWLSVTPTTGSTQGGFAILTAQVDPTGLVGGTYNSSLNLNVTGTDTNLSIPVRLVVVGEPSDVGTLITSVSALELLAAAGSTRSSQTIQLSADKPGTVHKFTASASSRGGWLTVEPFAGTVVAGTGQNVTINANAAATPGAGTYQGSVVFVSLLSGTQTTIPVKFTVAAQAIAAEPASLAFAQPKYGVAPPPQTIQVRSNRPGSFSVMDVPSWLKVDPVQGPTPATLTVWAPISVLPPGSNNAVIRIVGPNNEVKVPVSLTVPEPPGPTVAPDSLTFAYQLGTPSVPTQSIKIASNVSDQVPFNVVATTESGSNWLIGAPVSGVTPSQLAVTINPALVVPGKNGGTLTVSSTDGSVQRAVPVVLNVTASGITVANILQAASLTPTPIAPGQIVTITGTGIGPATGVAASPTAAGAIDSRLGDIRVLFDGVPAPLLFVRSDQINAIVPYAIYGRLSSRIQVESMGTNFSVPIEAKVMDAAPGLFTANGSGRGQAAALNADLTINSLATPARAGSVVVVYGTGEGQTDPPGQDGRIILTDLRKPLLPVSATIAGREAEVLYCGSASNLVSGAFQVNVRVPAGVQAGMVPIQIRIGSGSTQSGVTIAVQ